jgi:hypothetical protein
VNALSTHLRTVGDTAPPPSDVREARIYLLRDFVYDALSPVANDFEAVRLCLCNDDDLGARYHLNRAIKCVRAAAATFRELEALNAKQAAP